METINGNTPVFGLSKAQLRVIVETMAGEGVTAFDVTAQPYVGMHLGYSAEKIVASFHYTTVSGREKEQSAFVKWFRYDGPAEAYHYIGLSEQHLPLPAYYGSMELEGREMLFLENLDPINMQNNEFLSVPESFFEFLSAAAQFNAMKPAGRYIEQLSPPHIANSAANAVMAIQSLWKFASDGLLGHGLEKYCSQEAAAHERLCKLCQRVSKQVAAMPTGYVVRDLYPENSARRRDTGELLFLDHEHTGWDARFFDVARWIGAPDRIQPRCLPRQVLAEHYLKEYCARTSEAIDLNRFLEDTHMLWLAENLRMLDWRMGRALVSDKNERDTVEERRLISQRKLYEDLTMLVQFA